MAGLKQGLLAAALALAPLGAKADDLVVWWEKGFTTQEDEAVAEIIAAFEQGTGKQVELVFQQQEEPPDAIAAAFEAGQPPDFAFGHMLQDYVGQWAFEDRLEDLSDAVGPFSDLFDADVLDWALWPNARTGHRVLYALPIGVTVNHVHVWNSLLEEAGFTPGEIPREWDAFWSFWCDQVQQAVREATGREDIWGVGLPMSVKGDDTLSEFRQFVVAYGADYVTRDGRLIIDDPEIRQRLVKAIDGYTTLYRKGCTPPGSAAWGNIDNNEAFLSQTVVMTANPTLSIPNALKQERPDDYYRNVATIEWPLGPNGEPLQVVVDVVSAVVFRDGSGARNAQAFVRFLVAEGWLAHYLDFSAERVLPPMSRLLEQPFWLDPSDPHRMASVMQVTARPLAQEDAIASGDWRYIRIDQEQVWAKAIHRVVTENISPEQAVDEAIARIKQILAE
jgi:multiple sugar transport system substrate-binding protein